MSEESFLFYKELCYILSHYSQRLSYEVDCLINPICQLRKLRFREIKNCKSGSANTKILRFQALQKVCCCFNSLPFCLPNILHI